MRELDFLPLGTREDGGGFQFAPVHFQEKILLGRFREFQRDLFRLVAEVGAIDGMLSRGNVQRIESDSIGGDTGFAVFQEHDRLRKRFTALRVSDIAGQDDSSVLRVTPEE